MFSYLAYLIRDMGFCTKKFSAAFFRSGSDAAWQNRIMNPTQTLSEETLDTAVEKKFLAIGGGSSFCSLVDYVLAEAGSYFSLPARRGAIIPSAANLRGSPSFVGW